MARDTFCTVKQTMFSSIFLSVSRARTLRAIKRTISRSWVRTCWWPALGGSRPAPTTAQPPATSRPPSPYRWLLLLDVSTPLQYYAASFIHSYYYSATSHLKTAVSLPLAVVIRCKLLCCIVYLLLLLLSHQPHQDRCLLAVGRCH